MSAMSVPAPVLTPRLLLRPPALQDVAALHRVLSAPASSRSHAGPISEQLSDCEALLRDWLSHWQQHGFGYWVVTLPAQPAQVLGCGGLMLQQGEGLGCLGLHLRFHSEAWGQGYGAELARAALALAFGVLHAQRVMAVVHPANIPSRRAMERIGMRLMGCRTLNPGEPAQLVYEMCPDTYRAQHASLALEA